LINVADIVSDPDLAQPFTIERSKGQFGLGGWQNTPESLPGYGVIQVATEQNLTEIPEGDRVTGSMVFFSAQPIYRTHGGENPGLSDVLVWRNQTFRVMEVFSFADYGYYKAIAVRMSGE
jgi:hypothetical protein